MLMTPDPDLLTMSPACSLPTLQVRRHHVVVSFRYLGYLTIGNFNPNFFAFSIAYLFILFGAVVADHWWPL